MTEQRYFLVSDVSGAPVTSLAPSSFLAYLYNNGVAVTGSNQTITEMASGVYMVSISNAPVGELYLKLDRSPFYIAPDFHEWTQTSYDVDDVYGRLLVATSTTALPVVPSQRYSVQTFNTKDNDAITETVQVPARFRPLTGWTDISIQAYPAARTLTPSSAPLSGTYSATVIDASAGLIDIVIAENVVNNLVPAGVASVQIFADLQGDDPDGYRKTMMQFNITVNRDYNSDT
jgi:hypothetical protein